MSLLGRNGGCYGRASRFQVEIGVDGGPWCHELRVGSHEIAGQNRVLRTGPPEMFTEGLVGLSLSKNRLPAHSVLWLPPPSIIAVLLTFAAELATAMLLYHFTSLAFTQLSSPRQVAVLVLSQLLW